ncbi:MAG: CARDB domain-containing protein [Dehalococcoidia bacterium]|nr:CARDB domain-containing protein [Dehalococcoidia bacterium]MDD5494767.1 CARDB domain-containing protein [Dehalococcoidia bacterium]
MPDLNTGQLIKRKTKIHLLIFFVFMAAALLFACASQPEKGAANFVVTSLNVTPSHAFPGDEVTVTTEITNTGSMIGNYNAVLLINGKQADSKLITIPENMTKTATFTIKLDQPGTYSINLDTLSTALKISAMVEKEVELKYDTGDSEDALWAGTSGGFLIDFTPPGRHFTLKKIRICGGIYGVGWERKSFELYILDKNKNILLNYTYPVDKFPVRGAFPYQPPVWVDFDMPSMKMTDSFYVYLYTNMKRHYGIQIGVDDSIVNEHSSLGAGKPPEIVKVSMGNLYPRNIWYSDETRVNWMIRVVGAMLEPGD